MKSLNNVRKKFREYILKFRETVNEKMVEEEGLEPPTNWV